MKKLCLFLTMVVAGFSVAKAQGLINIQNFSSIYYISTNGNLLGTGRLTTSPDNYYFALLISASQPASSNPLTGGWSVAQSSGTNVVGNNSHLIAGGVEGGNNISVDGWTVYSTNYIEIVGWSVSLGTTWEQIANQLQNGWSSFGYYGVSGMGMVASGGSPGGGILPTPSSVIWGPGNFSSAGLTGIPSGFVLNGIPIPEPSSLALAVVGGSCLMFFRRRKN